MSPQPQLHKSRQREKQASRDADAHALASGEKSREQRWRENSFIPPRSMTVDYRRLRPRDPT